MTSKPTETQDVTAGPAGASAGGVIAHSDWLARKRYVLLATLVLLGVLVYAIHVDRHVDAVAWLLSTLFVLFLVAPSAEQAVKMLATVAALRAGVAITTSAESGDAKSVSSAVPTSTIGD